METPAAANPDTEVVAAVKEKFATKADAYTVSIVLALLSIVF